LKHIKDEDIEIFLHYNPEVAIQIVNDLVDEPANMAMVNHAAGQGPGSASAMNHNVYGSNSGSNNSLSNAIDRETRGIAVRIKKCPHYKSYKAFYKGGSLRNI